MQQRPTNTPTNTAVPPTSTPTSTPTNTPTATRTNIQHADHYISAAVRDTNSYSNIDKHTNEHGGAAHQLTDQHTDQHGSAADHKTNPTFVSGTELQWAYAPRSTGRRWA